MFTVKDLKLGTKVLVFDSRTSEFKEMVISELSLSNPYSCMAQSTSDETVGSRTQVQLDLHRYKQNIKGVSGSNPVWCFADSNNFITAVKKVIHTENRPKKLFADYDKYPHNNNKNQIEKKLHKQRVFITKVIEQGFVWYLTHNGYGSRIWLKQSKPDIDFRDNNYYLHTPCGMTCVKKEGKSLSLDNPNTRKELE